MSKLSLNEIIFYNYRADYSAMIMYVLEQSPAFLAPCEKWTISSPLEFPGLFY